MSRKSLTLLRNRAFLPAGGLSNSPETLILVLERTEQFIGESDVSGGNPMNRIGKAFPRAAFYIISADSPLEELMNPVRKGKYERILIISSDASLYPSAMQAIREISELGPPLGLVLMRNPYEAAYFTKANFILLTYEDTVLAAESLIDFLKGTISAEGKCPVRIPGQS